VRFTTNELGDLEKKIVSAADRAQSRWSGDLDRLAALVTGNAEPIKRAAEALSMLDAAAALATLAVERDYVRPEVDRSLAFCVEAGPSGGRAGVARGRWPFVAMTASSRHRRATRPAAIY